MRSKIREDSIKKTIHDKQRCDWQRARASYDKLCNGSHVLSAVSCQLEHYRERVGAFLRELQCIPLLGNLWSAPVQKLPLA